ncbi:hypothetical protein ZWY2020_023769, partial [Hordeum vulgare]
MGMVATTPTAAPAVAPPPSEAEQLAAPPYAREESASISPCDLPPFRRIEEEGRASDTSEECEVGARLAHGGLPSQRLSGKLSPDIGNLTRLQSVLLQNNAISGTIPSTIGRLGMLQTLDMSDNHLTGSIPTSLGDLKNLNYLGLSFNNLSGPVPKISARTFRLLLLMLSFLLSFIAGCLYNIAGNSMICGVKSGDNCSSVSLDRFLIHQMTLRHINGKPALDWSRRKMIALGTARGLLYLHEQCDPKIIHHDVKASNVLLDEYFEAIVRDFRLAKLLDHQETHVTTAVRGTVGHIAPEYLSTGQSSEKIDVFGFGVLLVELITGQKALDFGSLANQKGGVLICSVYGLCIGTIIVSHSCMWWFHVKKLHQEKQLNMMVDKDLGSNYDRVEPEEMVQVALMCTRNYPSHRPQMSE